MNHAFHSPLMDPMLDRFRATLEGIEFHPPALPVVSTVTGDLADETCPWMLDTRHTWILTIRVDGSPVQMVMKHYPQEFRAEAVALYRSRPGTTIKSVAQDLGVNHGTLRNWIRLDDAQRTGAPTAASAPAPASPEDENAALRRRIRELEKERDILRKAARYFAGETRW